MPGGEHRETDPPAGVHRPARLQEDQDRQPGQLRERLRVLYPDFVLYQQDFLLNLEIKTVLIRENHSIPKNYRNRDL